ncbi:MAG TPA: hypothetical protein VN884_09105 [Candidatus Sulfotelmatobacter sp.]|nr:hypothetical protein [Candidatus Sulfotelmatobacter sp.]
MRQMASVGMYKSASVVAPGAFRAFSCTPAILLCSLTLLVVGCQRMMPLDTKPLDNVGMSYSAIKQLQALDITSAELAEVAKARAAGFPDDSCIEMVRIYHSRKLPFGAGDTVAGLVKAHLRGDTILQLAKLDELGINAEGLELIRLAGFSDSMVLEVASHEAAGKPVFSGATLSSMKNAGMREPVLLELVRRNIPDSEAPAIIGLHRHGARDADILRRYTGA